MNESTKPQKQFFSPTKVDDSVLISHNTRMLRTDKTADTDRRSDSNKSTCSVQILPRQSV